MTSGLNLFFFSPTGGEKCPRKEYMDGGGDRKAREEDGKQVFQQIFISNEKTMSHATEYQP